MLGIGFLEMIVIAGIALVVIGPEKFPDFAKLAVRTIRELRSQLDDMKKEINKELKPVKEELRSLKEHSPEKYIDTLSKPIVAPVEPLAPKHETPAVQDEGNASLAKEEPVDDATPNPEPEEGAWQREEYKVAGQDDFNDFKAPERLD